VFCFQRGWGRVQGCGEEGEFEGDFVEDAGAEGGDDGCV